MFGQQAGPKNVGQKSSSCNEPLIHEIMLSQVSSLINTRNAKKLAQKGVLQTEYGKCPSKSLMPVSQNEKNNYCVDPSSQETAEMSSLKASQDGKISKRPSEASLERHCDHEQTSTDKKKSQVRIQMQRGVISSDFGCCDAIRSQQLS